MNPHFGKSESISPPRGASGWEIGKAFPHGQVPGPVAQMDRARLVLLVFGTLSWAEPALGVVRAHGEQFSLPATPIPSKTSRGRRSPGFTSRDLFGNFIEDFDFSPLSHVPYSSYLGEMAPFWSFPTNGKFKLIDYNAEPRRRARAAFELAWERLGRGIHTAQDRLDTVSSESEEDPEPPMRPEEFISENEKPRDVPTRPKYGVPGGWAKGEIPRKKVDIGFVPLQIYSQTRRIDVEEHLPRERAEEDAETEEERIAAPRLREVLKDKKLQEVYEEEGYEDSGYDHGGYNHYGEKVEDAVVNEGKTVFKKIPKNGLGADSDAREAGVIFSRIPTIQSVEELRGSLVGRSVQRDNPTVPLNGDVPKLEMGKTVMDSGKVSEFGNNLNVDVKQNMTIYIPDDVKFSDRVDIAQRRTGSGLESRIVNNPSPKIAFPGKSSRRLYTSWNAPDVVSVDGNFEEATALPKPKVINIHHVASYLPTPLTFDNPTVTPVQFSSSTPLEFASTINTYASLINQNFSSPLLTNPVIDYTEYDSIQPSYSTTDDYTWAQSSIHEKTVTSGPTGKPIKFVVATNSDATTTKSTIPFELQISTENPRRQSGGHRGRRRGSNRTPATQSSSTESEITVPTSEDSSTSPTRSRKINANPFRSHKIYSNFTRGNVKYNPEDDSQWTPAVGTPNIRHPSLPFDNGEHKEAISEVNKGKEQEVAKQVLNITMPSQEEISTIRDSAANAKYVEQLTLAHYSVPANLSPQKAPLSEQDERLKELAKHLNSAGTFQMTTQSRRKRALFYDTNKYPYYASPPSISKDSALKYATNPIEVPKKTYGGMEFYESKDSIQCAGPPQPKDITPKREEDGEWNGEPKNIGPRVKGVGNTIDCFKRKFFGRDPLDNPFFKEETVQSFERIHDSETFEKSLPLKTHHSGQRRIMVFGHHPSPNLTTEFKIAEPVLKTTISHSTHRPYEGVSITTPLPINSFNGLYQVYEANQDEAANKPPYKYKHFYSLYPGKSQYLEHLKKHQKYTPHSVSTYSVINNRIPAVSHLVPPYEGNVKLLANVGAKNIYGGYGSGVYRPSVPPIYLIHPTDYLENKIIIRKRETDNSLWNLINPLKWWWPSLFDSRRHEPRYRRSAEDVSYDSVMPSSDEIYDVGGEMIEMVASEKPTTTQPITLSEFKTKFNISEPNKKTTSARLTGGFLNRNADITDVMEMLVGMGPSDSAERSTNIPSTKKPKVVFPRVKLPRRKAYPPSKRPGIISEFSTTELTTTTTTTTLPPPTTTRMYKPKRVIKKNYGKGPFDAFTVLRTQHEVKATKQTFDSTEAIDSGSRQEYEPTLSTENAGENESLTYMVNPATGVGSWSEQRRWKPKRKRPNRPSVYSYHKSKNMSSKKKQRDIPDPHPKVYVYGLMSKILNRHSPAEHSSTESSEELISRERSEQDYSKEVRSTSVKPPPKFILEPDKRRYYYAKVR